MVTHVQPHQPFSQKDDSKKEETRKEELEKRQLEEELRDMDAHAFYALLEAWKEKTIAKPYYRTLHVNLFQVKEVLWQPLPITRSDLRELLLLSKNTGKVLSLLRRVDQKGLECPYIHQVNRAVLEGAIEKCERLKNASKNYIYAKGLLARICKLFNWLHVMRALKDIDVLHRRLEAIVVMCRHQEFAQDLMRLRREVTFRTGSILKDDDASAKKIEKKSSFQPGSRPQFMKNSSNQLLKK